ncbi:TssQ family T6SS-associated lipoprotein [Rhizobacter sp. J219]|jgi:Tfp pilus assembly protein PilF|uniref:TssQ family T6SS-associated lipoprotein n=1 Tax=Rhizobacter sp. J219 TaxID=2898430 RepID=UPI002151C4AC|nr:TssQ family T6SS-associated lipoprotein [Rhizobacter sp. J219]MCR5883359.1 TssQ family T6SS-associated lipoprotein [Rhizobacter sp. J219]
MKTLFGSTVVSLALAALAGCASQPRQAPVGLMDVISRPAEKALQSGLRAYDDAQYADAEKQLNNALKAGLVSPRDQAEAHKVLAFIYCTSRRLVECEAEFRAAKASDPAFVLSKSEQGHPLWGPVYKKIP